MSETYHWAMGATGVVLPHVGDETDTVDGVTSYVTTLRGPVAQVWVEFDEPQLDGDGDGPYVAGVVDVTALEPLGPA